jgi:hypothetical protein
VTGWRKYGEFADFLEIKAASVSGAKARGAMPLEWAFRVAQQFEISTDWLLTGEQPFAPSDIPLLVLVVETFERAIETRKITLDWRTKGKVLGMIFENVKTWGYKPDEDQIEEITVGYLRVLETYEQGRTRVDTD